MSENRYTGISSLYFAKLVNAHHKTLKTFAFLYLWTCLHAMVIFKNQNEIRDFFYDFSLIVSL